jgi:hypothetical protein
MAGAAVTNVYKCFFFFWFLIFPEQLLVVSRPFPSQIKKISIDFFFYPFFFFFFLNDLGILLFVCWSIFYSFLLKSRREKKKKLLPIPFCRRSALNISIRRLRCQRLVGHYHS